MNVGDVIRTRKEVFSIRDDMTVHDAARYLRDHKVRAVGVLDDAGKLTGAISQSDISDKVAAENKCPAWMRVSEIMTRKQLVTVTPERTLDDCLREMEKHGIFHLIVIGAEGEFQGMISVTDLLEVIASDHKERADMFEAYIFPQR
jgi:CBS domain-containing protein